jgi:cell shape-determining protein MreC
MEDWLNKVLRSTKNTSVRIIIMMFVVFLALAGLISLVGDLGFGENIATYRWQIWIILIVLSVIGVLTYEVIKGTRMVSSLNNQIKVIKDQLEEAKKREDSLLRLMEKYKRSAYAEVLQHLDRLLILVIKRDEWLTNDAHVSKVRIKPYSGAEVIDPEFARKERIEIIISIGQKAGVTEGMEFLMTDSQIPLEYGLISVSKVYADGASCILIEELDTGFWAQFHGLTKKQAAKIVEAPDNRIVPYLPNTFDAITPESAENLRTIISKIVYNQQHIA